MRLYIIRHAQSVNNAREESERVYDPALTDLGWRQAQLLAGYLAQGIEPGGGEPGFRFTHLYCSPMLRAVQTTQPIAQALGLQPEVWVEVHEHGGIFLDHGPERGTVGYPGLSCHEMMAECPGIRIPEVVTEHGWWTGGREEWAGCEARALSVAEALRSRAAGEEHIAIVTHGGFLVVLLKALLGSESGAVGSYINYNTSISRLDWAGHRPQVRYLARVDHLPPDLIT